MRLAVLLILMRSISFWAAFLTFVSIRISNADAFLVTVTTKPLLLSSSWGSRQRKTPYRCWYSKVNDDETAEQTQETQEASSPARQTKYDKKWLEQYENLKEYNNKHGHCSVAFKEGSLGRWVNKQRSMFKQEKMREDRKKLLDESGFVWSVGSSVVVDDGKWLDEYENLKSYKKKLGHCNVPRSQGSLGKWVNTQRNMFKQEKMRGFRKKRLDGIGFVWIVVGGVEHGKWMVQCGNMKVYKKQHGHCNVPIGEGSLGKWAHKQRQLHKNNRLRKDRKDMLEEVGFVWEPFDEMW
jgi:hypothetical protein